MAIELGNHWRWLRRWNPRAQAALDEVCVLFPPEAQARGLARYYYEYLWILDEIMRALPGGVNGLRVADVGCGAGVLALALRRLGAEVWVLDRFDEYDQDWDNHMGRTSDILARFEQQGLHVSRRDLLTEGLPREWPEFDLMSCFAVIEHLPGAPRAVLEAMHARLRPGGWVVVTTPNLAWVRTRLRLLLGRSVHFPLATWWQTPFFGHIREYTRVELRQMLAWAGFTEVRCQVGNWAHLSSRLPRAHADDPERWTTRFTLSSPQRWLTAASLLLTLPFPSLQYTLLALARRAQRA